jgi:hypothetical protein
MAQRKREVLSPTMISLTLEQRAAIHQLAAATGRAASSVMRDILTRGLRQMGFKLAEPGEAPQ